MTDVLPAAPEAVVLSPLLSFDEACEYVVDYLKILIPLGFWSVSAYDAKDDRQVYLHLRDDVYGAHQGGSHAWSDSFCQYMVTGATPQIAPDAMSVPQYANAGVARRIDIGAYVGVPIQGGDGRLFGTLCGLDPQPQSDDLYEHATLLKLLATLLGQILMGERLREEADQSAAKLRWRAFHDELTGLPNRALFNDRLAHALALHRRDARPLSVLAWTSTTSRPSTTPSVIPAGTSCWSSWPNASVGHCGVGTRWRGWVATSSPSCWRTAVPRRRNGARPWSPNAWSR